MINLRVGQSFPENRQKRSSLWHRLLFRAADNLARERLVARPTQTFILNSRKEWMLTEEDYNKVLKQLNIPIEQKEFLLVKSFEVQRYDCKYGVCGFNLNSPNNLQRKVEAAHIVPHSFNGKDYICNGIALCRLHHWAFDVVRFGLDDSYKIIVSNKIQITEEGFGIIENFNFVEQISQRDFFLSLPVNKNNYPHIKSIQWQMQNILFK